LQQYNNILWLFSGLPKLANGISKIFKKTLETDRLHFIHEMLNTVEALKAIMHSELRLMTLKKTSTTSKITVPDQLLKLTSFIY